MNASPSKPQDVLYLFSGSRSAYKNSPERLPDTQLFGCNHLEKFGINTSIKELTDIPGGQLVSKIIGFRLRHMLLYFLTTRFAIVFGPSLVYQMPLKVLLGSRAKYILLNINLNSMLAKWKEHPLFFKALKFYVQRLDGIVCLSQYQANELVSLYGLPESMLTFIPLGVDASYYMEDAGVAREDIILSVGRDKGRDYSTLIDAARQLPQYQFIIVCSRRNLNGISEIPSNVSIRLDMSSNELTKLYHRAVLSVLPTIPEEDVLGMDCSGQTVLLDLMACGVPVVATQRSYIKDYARSGAEIVTVPPRNAEKLKSVIDELMQSPLRRAELSAAAQARVSEEFTTVRMAQRLAGYFETTLSHEVSPH